MRVDMGVARFASNVIPANGFGDEIVGEAIFICDNFYNATCVSMGNPHCVVFFDRPEELAIDELGPYFEKHALFPKKTNTEFVYVKDRGHVRMRVWERGAAVTLACGTGSCATLVAGVLNGLTDRTAEIELDGGRLTVEWGSDNHLYMTGPAEFVYAGEYQGKGDREC